MVLYINLPHTNSGTYVDSDTVLHINLMHSKTHV